MSRDNNIPILLEPEFLKKLEQLDILSKKIFQGVIKGERRSRKKGVSIEFADYRNYVSGDDIRFIDWNIYSRLDKLFLKLFFEEEELFFYILLDTSNSMSFGEPVKFDYAVKLAAALGYIGLSNMDRVGITLFNDDMRSFFAPKRGKGYLWQMFDFLGAARSGGKTNLSESCRKFVLQNKYKGIVVLVSDLLDPMGFADAFKWLSHGSYDVYIIHLLSNEEIKPDLAGHLELTDSETGERIEITVNEKLIKIYNATLNRFCEEARDNAVKRGFSYIPALTSIPVDRLLLDYLRNRGLLK